MVLKRALMAVLAATGLIGTAVFGQTTGPGGDDDHTHSVAIPAPSDFATLAACIRGQTDPSDTDELEGAHGNVADTAFSILTVASCEDIMRGSGRNAVTIESLSDLIAAARTRAANDLGTDFSDDDFDTMLAELKTEFGGDVLDRVFDEYVAEERADAARTTYNARLVDLNGDEDGTPTYTAATTAYNGITFDTDGDLENTTGINVDGVVKVDSILASADAATLTLPTVSKTMNRVTEDSTLGDVTIGTADSYDITYVGVETLLDDITELTNSRKDYQALLASGAPLTRSERRNLDGLIEAIDDALPLLEAKRDAVLALDRTTTDTTAPTYNADINSAVDAIEEYNKAKSQMDGLRRTLNMRIADLDEAKQDLYDAITDPGSHLQQLVTSTGRDEDASQATKDSIAELKMDYDEAAGEGTTSGTLLKALIAQQDTGGALIDAVKDLQTDMDNGGGGDVAALTAMDDPETDEDERGPITKNTDRIMAVEEDVGQLNSTIFGETDAQHDGLAACDATGLLNVATCADERSRHNETVNNEQDQKLMDKAAYIGNLGTAVGIDASTGEGTVMLADGTMGSRIDKNAEDIVAGDNAVRGEFAAADDMVRSDFAAADDMVRSGLTGMINSNTGMINDNRNMIGELSDDLDVVRAGVAASMALAGMPAVNGRGIAIGVGSYDGESAFAVGFQIQGEQASFKIGVTSSGGETGASAGVGFNF